MAVSNPVLIIVGAGPGIGRAAAERFAAAGYDIGLIGRHADRVEALADTLSEQGARVGWSAADAGDPAELSGALQRMTGHTERADVLLYNVGAQREASLLETSADDLVADLSRGTAGLLTAVQAILPILRQQRTGTILATGGGAADHPLGATIGIQKAALRTLVLSLARDLTPDGVHVATVTINGLVQPGTPFAPQLIADLYWDLVQETAGDPAAWRTIVPFGGDSRGGD